VSRIVPYILYLWLIGLHSIITRDLTAINSAIINLPALIVLLVALYKSETTAAWFGFAAGLVMAAEDGSTFGWHALAMTGLAVAAYNVRQRLNVEAIHARLIVVVGGLFIHNAFLLAVKGGSSYLQLLLTEGLTGAVYSTVPAWIFFLIKDKKLTYRKLRALF